MQNFTLLRALGKVRKPVLLKRGLAATIEEWLLAAEYILAGGNEQVILCERGIRTFETAMRNTLDLAAVAYEAALAPARHRGSLARDGRSLAGHPHVAGGGGGGRGRAARGGAPVAGASAVRRAAGPHPERFQDLMKRLPAVLQAMGRDLWRFSEPVPSGEGGLGIG